MFEKDSISYYEKVQIKNARLIVGLPGIGLVGRIAGDYMATKLNAEAIASIYSPKYPPQMNITDGIVDPVSIELYHEKENNFLFMLGDVQPVNGVYEWVDFVFKKIKPKISEIITIGGYGLGKYINEPKVHGAATDEKTRDEFKQYGVVFDEFGGPILGVAGMMIARAAYDDIPGISLLVETHGQYPDPIAAKRAIEVISKHYGIEIDMKDINKSVKDLENVMNDVMREQAMMETPPKEDLSYFG